MDAARVGAGWIVTCVFGGLVVIATGVLGTALLQWFRGLLVGAGILVIAIGVVGIALDLHKWGRTRSQKTSVASASDAAGPIGVLIKGGSNARIVNNEISGLERGIEARDTSGLEVSGNKLSGPPHRQEPVFDQAAKEAVLRGETVDNTTGRPVTALGPGLGEPGGPQARALYLYENIGAPANRAAQNKVPANSSQPSAQPPIEFIAPRRKLGQWRRDHDRLHNQSQRLGVDLRIFDAARSSDLAASALYERAKAFLEEYEKHRQRWWRGVPLPDHLFGNMMLKVLDAFAGPELDPPWRRQLVVRVESALAWLRDHANDDQGSV